MKTFIEKIPLSENSAFVAKIFKTPYFEVPWHQHIACEIILFLEGDGLTFIGNYTGEFFPGDLYFIGKNMPHTFQKRDPNIVTSALVVQFKEDFLGNEFMNIPETKELHDIYREASHGLQILGETKAQCSERLMTLPTETGILRIVTLLECLHLIHRHQEYLPLSTRNTEISNKKERERIDQVFRYTRDNFTHQIRLQDVARIAGLSVPAFCNYFKKSTKKTYIDFLNEIRVGHACKLLFETDLNVVNICFESGYNTLANFNKQFLKIKQITPSKYRKLFTQTV